MLRRKFHGSKVSPDKLLPRLKECYQVLSLMTEDTGAASGRPENKLLTKLQARSTHPVHQLEGLSEYFNGQIKTLSLNPKVQALQKHGKTLCKDFTATQLYLIKAWLHMLLPSNESNSSLSPEAPADAFLRCIASSVSEQLGQRFNSKAKKFKTLASIIKDEIMSDALLAFLGDYKCSELLEFYLAVERFKDNVTLKSAIYIRDTFLSETSEKFVTLTNLDRTFSEIIEELNTRLINPKKGLFDFLQNSARILINDYYFISLSSSLYFPDSTSFQDGIYNKLGIPVEEIQTRLMPPKEESRGRRKRSIGLLIRQVTHFGLSTSLPTSPTTATPPILSSSSSAPPNPGGLANSSDEEDLSYRK